MPENGFLQGLFLREQLDAARRNQEAQIAASERMQDKSQALSREQFDATNKLDLQRLALQLNQNAENKKQNQIINQTNIANALASDRFRMAGAEGLPQFMDMGMPPPQADFQPAPTPPIPYRVDPMAPPMFAQTPRLDSTFATAQMPAPAGSVMKIGDQQIVIPSKGQRFEEDQIAKQQSALADIQTKELQFQQMTKNANLSKYDIEDYRAQFVFGMPARNRSLEQGAQDLMREAMNEPDLTERQRKIAGAEMMLNAKARLNAAGAGARMAGSGQIEDNQAKRISGVLMPKVQELAYRYANPTGNTKVQPTLDLYQRAVADLLPNDPTVPAELRARIQQYLMSAYGATVTPTLGDKLNNLNAVPGRVQVNPDGSLKSNK